MKRFAFLGLALASWLTLLPSTVRADEEDDLIATLKSNAAAPARAEACKRLRVIGTAKSVPALASLLPDERLSQPARYALEGLPFPEATAAFRESATNSKGLIKAGLLDSLGWRRDTESIPLLTNALLEVDDVVAASAASALGRVGGAKALAALDAARDRTPASVARAVRESLLAIAEQLLSGGDRTGAEKIYGSLLAPTESENIRQAAFAGSIRAAGEEAMARLRTALTGNDGSAQAAALQIAGETRTQGAVPLLTELLPAAAPALQIGLIAALHRRGDPTAAPAILEAAGSTNPAVRIAAYSALGTLGDATSVGVIARDAASTNPPLQQAARDALLVLQRGEITATLVELIGKTQPLVERELFRAIAGRAEPSALPALLKLARSENADTRTRALQTLGKIAEGRDIGALVELLSEARDDAMREEIQGVFETLFERRRNAAGFDIAPVQRALASGPRETREALLPVVVSFADPRLMPGLRAALNDPEARTRSAAAHALTTARDIAWVPDLVELARQTQDAKLRTSALQAIGRLNTEEPANAPAAQRAEALASTYSLARSPEDKRTVLSAIALVPHRTSVEILDRACADPDVKADAELASLLLAQRMGGAEFERVQAVLNRLAAGTINPAVQTNAQALLRQLDSHWLYAGPFRQEGKEASQMFDVLFPPESTPKDPGTEWRRAPGSADPARRDEVDLSSVTGGNHCVLYAKTRVHVPTARNVTLALGSDDGIKLWINGKLVHANNAVRGLTPGEDRATASLQEGWNDFLVKITQHTAGCGFTMQLRGQDGSVLKDVALDPKGGQGH